MRNTSVEYLAKELADLIFFIRSTTKRLEKVPMEGFRQYVMPSLEILVGNMVQSVCALVTAKNCRSDLGKRRVRFDREQFRCLIRALNDQEQADNMRVDDKSVDSYIDCLVILFFDTVRFRAPKTIICDDETFVFRIHESSTLEIREA